MINYALADRRFILAIGFFAVMLGAIHAVELAQGENAETLSTVVALAY